MDVCSVYAANLQAKLSAYGILPLLFVKVVPTEGAGAAAIGAAATGADATGAASVENRKMLEVGPVLRVFPKDWRSEQLRSEQTRSVLQPLRLCRSTTEGTDILFSNLSSQKRGVARAKEAVHGLKQRKPCACASTGCR